MGMMNSRRTAMHALVAVLAAVLFVASSCVAGTINIDGNMDDWTGGAAYEMPAEALAKLQTPFAAVENLWIGHDDTFLYFRVRWERSRPFADQTQAESQKGYWANRRYIVLDVNGDAQPDYMTTQISLKDAGFNRTYVVDLTGEEAKTYLWYEGHGDWDPQTGPQGHYSPDGREIEIRVPREPLGIQGTIIGVQVKMSVRDAMEGPNAWTNDVYPSVNTWFLYDLATAAAVQSTEAAGPPALTMVKTQTSPQLDGVLDDAAWKNKPTLDGFLLNRGNAPASARTIAHLTWDDNALYVGVRAEEPRMDLLTTDAVEAEAKRVWRDDLIELFVDFHNDDTTFTHLGITAAGAKVGQFYVVSGAAKTAIDIEPDINVAWKHGEDHWIVEAAIGWSTFGVRPKAGEVWGLNINRGRPHAGEYSSWAGVQGGFLQPTAFGEMYFPHEDGLRVTSRGMAARRGNPSQANTFTAEMPDAPLTASVSVSAAGDESYSDSVSVEAGEAIELPYVIAGESGETVAFEMARGEKTLYKSIIPVVQTEFPKVWVTENPVYEDLLGDEGPGMAGKGVIYWAQELNGGKIAPVVLKHAQAWDAARRLRAGRRAQTPLLGRRHADGPRSFPVAQVRGRTRRRVHLLHRSSRGHGPRSARG